MSVRLQSQESFDSKVNVTGNFNGAQTVSVHGSVVTAGRDYISINHIRNGEEVNILDRLAAAACLEASHDIVQHVDRPKCHEGTRQAVIQDIMSWVDSDNPSNKILWLKGPAGAGKSSIAQTVCIKCEDEGKLLSSFFFSRAAGGPRADGNRLIATIAYHITQEVPETSKFVLKELTKNPALLSYTSAAMNTQLEKLVLNPLSLVAGTHTSSIPHILVVDGLDEVNNTDMQAEIIKLFAVMLASSDVKLKVLIASRPELEIRTAFDEPFVHQLTQHIVLDFKYKPDEDIHTYLTSELLVIKRTHIVLLQLCKETTWPAQKDIKELVERSSGQFIYAATVVKYIGDKRHNPIERLKHIICIAPGQEAQYKELDALYTHILNTAARKAYSFNDFLPVFQVLLFHGQEATPVITDIYNITEFLNITIEDLLLKLIDLHSLLFIPSGGGVLELYHTSFADYLTDASRSGHFYVNKKIAHKYIARCCFQRILDSLSEQVAKNDSIKVALEDDHSVTYSLEFYLVHMAKSDFDNELLSEFGILNQYIGQLLMNQIFMQMIMLSSKGSQMIDIYQILNEYYLINDNCVQPRDDKLKPLCELMTKAVDAFALTHLYRSERFHLHQISILANLQKPKGLDYERLSIYDRWIEVVLNDPDRGKQFYMDNERCQHIWRRVWKILQDPTFKRDILGCILIECEEVDLAILFRYLLHRIKPCPSFNIFLKGFEKIFDLSYYRKCHPNWKYSRWLSIEGAIAAYNEECSLLDMTRSNIMHDVHRAEESEDIPLTEGIQVPWIFMENDSDGEYITCSLPYIRETVIRSTEYTQKEDSGEHKHNIEKNLPKRSDLLLSTTEMEVVHMDSVQAEIIADVDRQSILPAPVFLHPGYSVPATLQVSVQQLSTISQHIGYDGLIHIPVEVKIGGTPIEHYYKSQSENGLERYSTSSRFPDSVISESALHVHMDNIAAPIRDQWSNNDSGDYQATRGTTRDAHIVRNNEVGRKSQYREVGEIYYRLSQRQDIAESYNTSFMSGPEISTESHLRHGIYQSEHSPMLPSFAGGVHENLCDISSSTHEIDFHTTWTSNCFWESCGVSPSQCIPCPVDNASNSGQVDSDMIDMAFSGRDNEFNYLNGETGYSY